MGRSPGAGKPLPPKTAIWPGKSGRDNGMMRRVTPGRDAATEPRKRRLGRPPTLDRDAALRAAQSVVAARGFDRTRYADVAEAAGVPVTTLQHAFGSLEGMLLESVQRSTASEIALLRDLSRDTTLSPWERISTFVRGAVSGPGEPDSWRLWLEYWRLASRDAEIGAHAGVLYAQWWDYMQDLIELGVESGDFSGPLVERPRDAALAVVSVIDGVAVSLLLRADSPDYERTLQVSIDSIAAMLGYRGAVR